MLVSEIVVAVVEEKVSVSVDVIVTVLKLPDVELADAEVVVMEVKLTVPVDEVAVAEVAVIELAVSVEDDVIELTRKRRDAEQSRRPEIEKGNSAARSL